MKRFILPVLILFCYPLFAQTPDPGMMPRWGRFKDYLQNGTMTFTYKTLTSPTITGTVAANGKWTIGANYPWVSSSSLTVDSLVAPYVTGNTELKGKLTIAANYPLVSSAGVTADSLSVTAGNMTVIDIDSVATAGGANRWLKITVSKAGATGKPVTYWLPADTATVL